MPHDDSAPAPVLVGLGALAAGGIAPSVFAMVERGAGRRPAVASSLHGTFEIRFTQRFAPVRIVCSGGRILVEDVPPDGGAGRADVTIRGSLPDVVQLVSVPLVGGVPRPTSARGRAALASITAGRVKIEGSRNPARRLLQLLEI